MPINVRFKGFHCYCACTYFLTASHKMFKGVHKIRKLRLQVQATSTPPTSEQRWNAVYSIGPQSIYTPPPTTRQQTVLSSTSPQPEVQQGTVAQSTGNVWPDPFDNNNVQNIPHMPPLEGAHGSSDHVGVKQPVGPHPPISGVQCMKGGQYELQKPLTMIEAHPVASGNMLPNTKRPPPGFQNPLTRKGVSEETGNNDFSKQDKPGSNQPPPVLSIKVEGFPKDWDESVLEMAFDNPDLGRGEIASMRGDAITFKDPKGQFPWLQNLMIAMSQH